MAGGYRLLMSRAKVTVSHPALPGDDVVHTATTVTVRDGVAKLTGRAGELVAPLTGVTVQRHSARRATVVGDDGTVWQVERRGGG